MQTNQYSQLIEKIFELFLHSTGIVTDSRHPRKGSIFFALKGDHFNANAFAQAALEGGCAYAVIDDPNYQSNERTLYVPNTLICLQNLAHRYRKCFAIPVLGITGTNGKTTTKELIVQVLAQKYRVHATAGNFNNHIGVPLTLLSMPRDTEIGIIEMGANHPGEIDLLCRIAEPTHGLITGIGKAHLEGFGSVEGIIKTKGELYDWLKAHQGTAFCNTSDPHLVKMARLRFKYPDTCVCYGPQEQQTRVLPPSAKQPFLAFAFPNGTAVHTQLAGDYNLNNVLAALAVGTYFKLPEQVCIRGIEAYSPKNHRSQWIATALNTLLVDAYNANPTSMRAALTSFASWTDPHKAVILGDMFELGSDSTEEHRQIIQLLPTIALERVFLVGGEFKKALSGLSTPDSTLHFEDRLALIDYLKAHPLQRMTLLIKGSRGMKLETLIEYL